MNHKISELCQARVNVKGNGKNKIKAAVVLIGLLTLNVSVGRAGWVSSGKPSAEQMQAAQKAVSEIKPEEIKGKVCPIIKDQAKLKEVAKKTGCTPAEQK